MFIHRLRVLYADTDAAGIVYHANYLRFFEAARGDFLRAGGVSYSEVERRGYVWPVVETWIRHRRPARYDDLLAVHLRVRTLGRASVEFVYEVRLDATGELLCEGSNRIACTRREGGVVPIPDDVRRVLENAWASARPASEAGGGRDGG